jgi:hypothetical protein
LPLFFLATRPTPQSVAKDEYEGKSEATQGIPDAEYSSNFISDLA